MASCTSPGTLPIYVFQLVTATKNSGDNSITATFLGNIASSDYHTPAMSDLYDGNIYSVNSYFAALDDIRLWAPANNTVVSFKNMYPSTANMSIDLMRTFKDQIKVGNSLVTIGPVFCVETENGFLVLSYFSYHME